MSKERANRYVYIEECRAGVIAEIGRMEARGFNVRSLKEHIGQTDREINERFRVVPCPESPWERDWREYEEENMGRVAKT